VPSLDDDLDWLYRRGRYADRSAAPDAAAPMPGTPGPAPRSPAPQAAAQVAPQQAAAPQRFASTAAPATHTSPGQLPPRVRSTRQAAEKRGRPGRVRRILIGVGVVLLAFVVYLVAVPLVAWSSLEHVAYAPTGNRPAEQPGTLLLLAGSDSREGLTPQQIQQMGTGTEGGNVADTIMLLYLPPTGRPALISIPRDSYLPIPGHNKNKINASFSFGGPKLLTQTIEQATGLRIDGYLGIGFGGFVNIIDAVGGVEQCPATDLVDKDSNLNVKAGCQNMDGLTALAYVRMRHADPLGDLGRVQRQRSVVIAAAKKAVSPATILNPFAYFRVNKAAASALEAGEGTGLTQIAPAALAVLSISRGEGLTLTVPVSNPNLSTPAGSAVEWDKTRSAELFGMIARGDTSGLDKFK